MEIHIDNISLPRITCGKVSVQPRELLYSSRIIQTYGEILLQNPSAQDIVRRIGEDPRVKTIDETGLHLKMAQVDHLESDHSDKSKQAWFPNTLPEQLSIWFLWRASEVGVSTANKDLNKFLDANVIEVIEALWLFGPRSNISLVSFDGGVELRPVRLMPESNEREAYTRINYEIGGHFRSDGCQRLLMPFEETAPTCALVSRISVPKLRSKTTSLAGELAKSSLSKKKFSLENVALMMNLLDGLAVYPSWHKRYIESSTPFGPMTHTGASLGIPRIVLGHRGSISQNDAPLINKLTESYQTLSDDSRHLLLNSIHRFRNAKFMISDINGFLDLSISLESTLLAGNSKTAKKAKRFRNLGCRLLGETPGENSQVWQQLYNLYDVGSRIRHEGIVKLDMLERIKTQEELDEFISPKNFIKLSALTGRILQALILSDQSPLT